MDTIEYIIKKYNIDPKAESPIWLTFDRNVDLPVLFRELGFTKGAEIGVLGGQFSERLCQEMPDATIYSIDKWEFYPVIRNFRKAYHYPPLYEETVDRLKPFSNSVIIKEWSLDAAEQFEDESLDFVFIDADHRFEKITEDICAWTPKVRKGGIISGHDFAKSMRRRTYNHVPWVVEAWTASHHIKPWFVLDHPGERSWMFVRGEDA